MFEALARKELKYGKRLEAQRQLDQKQRAAAGKLSGEEVMEGYVTGIYHKIQGKGKVKDLTGVDFQSMLPAAGSTTPGTVVLVDDIDDSEKQKRLHSKQKLEELKQLKAQRKQAASGSVPKNYQSPGAAQGQNAAEKSQTDPANKGKGKGKAKGKGKGKGPSQKGKGKGKNPESQASGAKPRKGGGKGKNQK